MTAPRITAEEIGDIKRLFPAMRRVASALESAYAELDAVTAERNLFRKECVALVRDCIVSPAELDRLSAQGGEVPELRERLAEWEEFRSQFSDLSYHHSGMGCGIEDRGITDRYKACEYGWEEAMERVAERMPKEREEIRLSPPHPDTVEVSREAWEALTSIATECSSWYIQPYAGSRNECLFCGKREGLPHTVDCFSVKAVAALRAQAQPTTEREV